MKYSTLSKTCALSLALFIAAMLALTMFAGCAGVAVNANVGTVFSVGATNAAVQLPQAQAGTLPVSTCLDAITDAGERFKVGHANLASMGEYVFDNKNHGMWFIDQLYIPAFSLIAADALALEDRCLGTWKTTPPDLATANAAAAQSLKSLLIVQAMILDKTTQTVSLKKPATVKAGLDLQTIIAKIGGQAVWDKLTPDQQAAIEADAAAAAAWLASNATSQFTAWWNNILSGDTIAASQMARDAYTDANLVAAFTTDNGAAVQAVAVHVQGQVAFIAVLQQIGADVVALIPTILSRFGL